MLYPKTVPSHFTHISVIATPQNLFCTLHLTFSASVIIWVNMRTQSSGSKLAKNSYLRPHTHTHTHSLSLDCGQLWRWVPSVSGSLPSPKLPSLYKVTPPALHFPHTPPPCKLALTFLQLTCVCNWPGDTERERKRERGVDTEAQLSTTIQAYYSLNSSTTCFSHSTVSPDWSTVLFIIDIQFKDLSFVACAPCRCAWVHPVVLLEHLVQNCWDLLFHRLPESFPFLKRATSDPWRDITSTILDPSTARTAAMAWCH